MMPTPEFLEIVQGTPEWFAIRCGKITGTRFAAVLTKGKKRDDLIWTLAAERIQGYQPEGPNSYSLKWGTENEPRAREAYQLKTGAFVTQQGFTTHRSLTFVGVSLDGLVTDDNGIIEIKSPKCPEIHLQRFIEGVPVEYIPQIQGCLWTAKADYCDFVSYDPDTADKFKLLVIRVERDEKFIANLERECLLLEGEVRVLIKKLMEKVN